MFVFVRISEVNFDERTSTSRVMKDSSDDTLDVALSFDEVKISISWWCDSFGFWSGVDTAYFTFSLATNNFTHGENMIKIIMIYLFST
jgi:hypothetical protein